jgi:hypothetical protein
MTTSSVGSAAAAVVSTTCASVSAGAVVSAGLDTPQPNRETQIAIANRTANILRIILPPFSLCRASIPYFAEKGKLLFFIILPIDKVKTTGLAGGLHRPYKGLLQPRLKTHERFANRKLITGCPLPGAA